jgi:hypothetical protein
LINSASFGDINNPEALMVKQNNTTSVNLMGGYGNIDNYLQVNIHNDSTGVSASADYVATSDVGSETSSFVDVGINNSNFANQDYPVMKPLDSYLINDGGDLIIGTLTTDKPIRFFVGGAEQANVKVIIDSTGISASGSLIGSASYADSASYAPSISSSYAATASVAPNYVLKSLAIAYAVAL